MEKNEERRGKRRHRNRLRQRSTSSTSGSGSLFRKVAAGIKQIDEQTNSRMEKNNRMQMERGRW